jgi:uncharacterized membrane protein
MAVVAATHVAFAVGALIFGSGIFVAQRGTPLHRKLGHAYSACMLALNVSALMLYARTGEFGPFHIAALLSLATLTAGFIPAIRRKPKQGWLAMHWEFMFWSFVGLLGGASAEIAFRIPGLPYWPAVALGAALPIGIGAVVIYGHRRSMRPWIRHWLSAREI